MHYFGTSPLLSFAKRRLLLLGKFAPELRLADRIATAKIKWLSIIHATHRISMYLAGILGLCSIVLPPAAGADSGAAFALADRQAPAAPQASQQPPAQGQTQSIQPADQ